MRIPYFSLIAAGSLALGGCAYGNYGGLGFGVGYGGGYGSYGYASPYYGGYGYNDAYYGSFGAPYYGWYDNYYYPGTGMYVYDSYRRPHVWSDRQRSYWTSRQQSVSSKTGTQSLSTNWSAFPSRAHTKVVNGVPTATWHDSQRNQ